MIKVFQSGGLLISKEYEKEKFYKKIKSKLTRRSKNYNSNDYVTNKFYAESSKYLIIPRYFPVKDYVDCNIIDSSNRGENIDIEHNIKFRNNLQVRSADYMMNHENGVIQLNPGTGKTVITIYMICERKKKSLILVHKDYLATQWEERFLQHSNISEDNIIRVTSSNFKKALQKPITIITDQTFISLLKTKKCDFLKELYDANIGIFISDEVHTSISAPLFSQCSLYIPAKVVFGLSATPYRHDGNSDIIQFHAGNLYKDERVEGTLSAKVTIILINYEIDIPYRKKYLYWEGSFQNSRYLNLIKKSKSFLSVIKGLLNKFKTDRKIICVLERLKLIDLLYNWLDIESKSKFISGSNQKSLEAKTIFATSGKIRDGVDVPDVDCLIMSSPISNIAQIGGRVIRSHPDKKVPIIIDIVDIGCKRMSITLYKRLDYYLKNKWDTEFILITNGIKKFVSEETAIEIIEGR